MLMPEETRGRKLLFKTPEEFQAAALEYFSQFNDESKNRPVLEKLILHMGFTSRQSFYDYRKRPEFKDVCDWCHLMIEAELSQQLMNGRDGSGLIFALKNIAGWKDNRDIGLDHRSSDGSMTPKGKSLNDFYSELGDCSD